MNMARVFFSKMVILFSLLVFYQIYKHKQGERFFFQDGIMANIRRHCQACLEASGRAFEYFFDWLVNVIQGDFSQLLDKKMTYFSKKLVDFDSESITM